MYSIYVHTTPDGKKYVGSTSQEPNKRFLGGCNYKCSTRFYDAIKFFGWDNIQHQVLETVEDKETALKREEYYTLLLRSNEPEFGYNIYVGNIKNEESIKKISEKNKKPIKLKNKNTGDIFMFDSQQNCAEFFGVNNVYICRFIKGTRQCKALKDYKVLK